MRLTETMTIWVATIFIRSIGSIHGWEISKFRRWVLFKFYLLCILAFYQSSIVAFLNSALLSWHQQLSRTIEYLFDKFDKINKYITTQNYIQRTIYIYIYKSSRYSGTITHKYITGRFFICIPVYHYLHSSGTFWIDTIMSAGLVYRHM